MLTRPSGQFCYYHWLLKSRTMTVEVQLMMEKNGKKKKSTRLKMSIRVLLGITGV